MSQHPCQKVKFLWTQDWPDVPPDSRAGVDHQGGAVEEVVAVHTQRHSQGTAGAVHAIFL